MFRGEAWTKDCLFERRNRLVETICIIQQYLRVNILKPFYVLVLLLVVTDDVFSILEDNSNIVVKYISQPVIFLEVLEFRYERWRFRYRHVHSFFVSVYSVRIEIRHLPLFSTIILHGMPHCLMSNIALCWFLRFVRTAILCLVYPEQIRLLHVFLHSRITLTISELANPCICLFKNWFTFNWGSIRKSILSLKCMRDDKLLLIIWFTLIIIKINVPRLIIKLGSICFLFWEHVTNWWLSSL